jgi:hypothetical protein
MSSTIIAEMISTLAFMDSRRRLRHNRNLEWLVAEAARRRLRPFSRRFPRRLPPNRVGQGKPGHHPIRRSDGSAQTSRPRSRGPNASRRPYRSALRTAWSTLTTRPVYLPRRASREQRSRRCGTRRPAAPCRSGTGARASPVPRASSAPDSGASATSTDRVGSESQAPTSSADTTHPAMRGGRSTDVLPARRRARSRAPQAIQSPVATANPDRLGAHPSAPKRQLQRPSWTLLSAQLGE